MTTTVRAMHGDAPAILITGASSGIGRACALALDTHGFQVFAVVRTDSAAAALRRDTSSRLMPLFLDVTDAASILHPAATNITPPATPFCDCRRGTDRLELTY